MRDVKCRFLSILKERLNAESFCSLGMVLAVVVVVVVVVIVAVVVVVVVVVVIVVVLVILSNQDDLNLMD